MTETEWLTCTDPNPVLEFLQSGGKATERKMRLFAVACAHRLWPWLEDRRIQLAVEIAERFADGWVTDDALLSVYTLAGEATCDPTPALTDSLTSRTDADRRALAERYA